LQGIVTIVIGVGGCLGYFYFSNQVLDKVLFPANEGRERRAQHQPRQHDPALAVPVSRRCSPWASISPIRCSRRCACR
jgi:hypothetical protein